MPVTEYIWLRNDSQNETHYQYCTLKISLLGSLMLAFMEVEQNLNFESNKFKSHPNIDERVRQTQHPCVRTHIN